jgi:hypothetical protein
MKTAYIIYDIPQFQSQEQAEEFYRQVSELTIEFQTVNDKEGRRMSLVIIREDENIAPAFELFSFLNPVILGVVDPKGIPMGQTYVPAIYTYDEETEESTLIEAEHLEGEAEYPFNIPALMEMLPPKIVYTYGEGGEVLSSEEVPHTVPYLPIVPAGWDKPRLDLIL